MNIHRTRRLQKIFGNAKPSGCSWRNRLIRPIVPRQACTARKCSSFYKSGIGVNHAGSLSTRRGCARNVSRVSLISGCGGVCAHRQVKYCAASGGHVTITRALYRGLPSQCGLSRARTMSRTRCSASRMRGPRSIMSRLKNGLSALVLVHAVHLALTLPLQKAFQGKRNSREYRQLMS